MPRIGGTLGRDDSLSELGKKTFPGYPCILLPWWYCRGKKIYTKFKKYSIKSIAYMLNSSKRHDSKVGRANQKPWLGA